MDIVQMKKIVITRGKHAVLAVNGDTAHNSGSSVRLDLATVDVV